MARIEEDSQHEEIDRLELEETKRRTESELHLQRKRRELEQARIEKELHMEEAKVKIYKELDREDVQTKLFVGVIITYLPSQTRQQTTYLSALAFAAAMSLSRRQSQVCLTAIL